MTKTHIPKSGEDLTQNDHNLEEASTARVTPFDPEYRSYYSFLGKGAERILSDREFFAGDNRPGSKGLIGRAAVDAVESKFGESEIGKLQIYGTKVSAAEYVRKLKR